MRLFTINSPYWNWDMRPQRKSERRRVGLQSDDPLDEHHTFLYHMFLKHDLVDEVVIHSRREDDDRALGIPLELEFYGKKMRIEYDGDYTLLQKEKNQLLFCREFFSPLPRFPQHFRVVRSYNYGLPDSDRLRWLPWYVPWLCRPRRLDRTERSVFLAEGPYCARYTPRRLKTFLWPLVSKQAQYASGSEKIYDWIVVGTFIRRKRILEFSRQLLAAGMDDLRGCVIAAEPVTAAEQKRFEEFNTEIMPGMNIDFHMGSDCPEKIELVSRSKVFVSPSASDSGPRSVVEAGQTGVPVLAMRNHGGATAIVRPGVNGELTWSYRRLPEILKHMLSNYDKYDCSINKEILDPDKMFAPIARYISRSV